MAALFTAIGSVVVGAVTGLLSEGLKAAGKSFGRTALEKAISDSLRAILATSEMPAEYVDSVASFMKMNRSAQELAKLFGPGHDEPDADLLIADLESEGLDLATLRGVDVAGLFDRWIVEFCETCMRAPELHDLIAEPFRPAPTFHTIRGLRKLLYAHYMARLGRLPALGLFSVGEQASQRFQVELSQVYVPFRARQDWPSFDASADVRIYPYLTGSALRSAGIDNLMDAGIAWSKSFADSENPPLVSNLQPFFAQYSEAIRVRYGESWQTLLTSSLLSPRLNDTRIEDFGSLGPKIVITGDPGSGKSALLRYVATTLAREDSTALRLAKLVGESFPLVMSVGAYAKAIANNPDQTPLEFLGTYYKRHSLPDMGRLFSHHLSRGDSLVMLDGLDEVVDLGTRQLVVGLIESFVGAYEGAGNRFIVTSRSTGYDEAPLRTGFARLSVCPFSRREKRLFLQKWCVAFETLGGDNVATRRRAKEVSTELTARVEQLPEISMLATNPLLLTILAMIHYQAKRLPHRRVELYDCYLETFAQAWHRARDIADVEVRLVVGDIEVNERSVIMSLGPVAARIHEQDPGGVVDRAELARMLGSHFEESYLMPRARAAICADAFIRIIVQQVGLMSERGQGYFGFIHQTFEEHLVARYLAARTPEERWTYLDRRLHDPRWQEVILLTAGSLQGSNVDAMVSTILDAGSRNEQILHRDLMLAGRILSDDTSVTSGALLKRVMDGILQIALHSQSAVLRDQVREITARLAGGTNERYACEILETTVVDALPRINLYLLGLLSKFRYDERRLLEALAACARNGESYVRSNTARALAVLGIPGLLARTTIFMLAKDRTSKVAATAAVAMASDRSRSPEVVDTLVELLGHATARVRAAAAHSLGVLRPTRDDVPNSLYGLLSDRAFRVRASAAGAMAKLRPKDQRQVDAMVSTLVHRGKDRDSHFYYSHYAPEWYGETDPTLCVVPKDKRFLTGLLKLIEDRGRITRCRAAFALGRLQLADPDVYNALRMHLADRSAYVRLAAVSSLLSLGTEDENLARVIAKIALSDDPASRHAIRLSDKLPLGRAQIEAGLLERLKRCIDFVGRYTVLEDLATLRSDSENVIGVFGHELRTTRDSHLRNTGDSHLRKLAMEALLRTRPSSGTLRDALTGDIENPESEVRLRASVMLAEAGAASEKALDLLATQVRSEEKEDLGLMGLPLPPYEVSFRSSLDVYYGAMMKLAARLPRRTG